MRIPIINMNPFWTAVQTIFLLLFMRFVKSWLALVLLICGAVTGTSEMKGQGLSTKTQVEKWIELSKSALSSNYTLAKKYADSAQNLAVKLKLEELEYKAYELLALSEQSGGQHKESFEYFSKVYSYKLKIGKKKEAAHILNRMGESKRLMDDYKTALEYFQKSIRMFEELRDTNQMGSGFISIGILYAVKGDHNNAEKYFLQAIAAFKSTGNFEQEHLTMLNLGGMYKDFNQLEKSIIYSKKAAEYFESKGNAKRMAVARYNLGVAYFTLGKLAESKNEYQKCLPVFEKLGDKMRENGTLMRLAEIALKEGNTNQALEVARKALS